jgi:hypothetical protein
MMTKVQSALMFAAMLVAAPQVEAQRRVAVPFHVSAAGDGPVNETLTGVFSEEVPAGKRLLVQHVSVNIFGLDVTQELVLANCVITGRGLDSNGNPQGVQHFIPLTSRANLAARRESLTGGGPLTMRLEPGPINVTCSSGTDGQNLDSLQAHLSGELVAK